MKKLHSVIALLLICCMLFTACNENGGNGTEGSNPSATKPTAVSGSSTARSGEKSGKNNASYKMPAAIMTTEQYHNEINKILSGDTIGDADDAYLKNLDTLTKCLQDAITYNTQDLSPSKNGATYYVSYNGNDKNDGKTPDTAWRSLERARQTEYKSGDVLLLERGGEYRGWLYAHNNFKIGAYGTGHKPKIICAQSAQSLGGWEKTDKKNIWKLKSRVGQTDVGHLVYYAPDGNEICGDKEYTFSALDKQYEFLFNGETTNESKLDNFVYIYYSGDPNKDFNAIEIPYNTAVIETKKELNNFELNNLFLTHGRGPFWPGAGANNIKVSYCTIGWTGGFADYKGGVRYGGGSGVWYRCNNFVYDYCWFYQQFDSGVSPQYTLKVDEEEPAIFKDFKTTNCLFETCEYTLEYFCSQKNSLENRFENMYFAYNLCRTGGQGFGIKASQSAYIKSWDMHENTCINSAIEYNVFDRAAALTLEIVGNKQSTSGNELSLKHIPKLSHNVYIQYKNKKFANINKELYKFTKSDLEKYISLGADTDSRYMFAAS